MGDERYNGLWRPSGLDLEQAWEQYRLELVRLTPRDIFLAAVYSVLSAREKTERLRAGYTALMDERVTSPRAFVELGTKRIENIIIEMTSADEKAGRLVRLAEWWQISSLPDELLADAKGSREREFELRDLFARATKYGAPGMRWKCASYLMRQCGYTEVVPVDIWALRLLHMYGIQILANPELINRRGLTKTQHRTAERYLTDMAREQDTPPGIFHMAVYMAFEPAWYERREEKPPVRVEPQKSEDDDVPF